MDSCKNGLSPNEIIEKFGIDLLPEKDPCKSCPNLIYDTEILTCRLTELIEERR